MDNQTYKITKSPPPNPFKSDTTIGPKSSEWVTKRKKKWAARVFLGTVSGLILTGLVVVPFLTRAKHLQGQGFLTSHYVAIQVYAILGMIIVGAIFAIILIIFCMEILPKIWRTALDK